MSPSSPSPADLGWVPLGVLTLALGMAACVLPPEQVAELAASSAGSGASEEAEGLDDADEGSGDAWGGSNSEDEVPGETEFSADAEPIDSSDGILDEGDWSETNGGDDAATADEFPSCSGDCPCESEFCDQYCEDPMGECSFDCAPGSLCFQTSGGGPAFSYCTDANYCNFDCSAAIFCEMTCVGTGRCDQSCAGDCNTECIGSDCEVACPGGGCNLHCIDAEHCSIIECPFGCSLSCENVDECVLDCADPDTCTLSEL